MEFSYKDDPELARKVGIYFCRKLSERTLAEIGQFNGGMSVSGVSQTVHRLAAQRLRDQRVDRKLSRLAKKIRKV